jgi:hypothetical protein
MRREVDGDAAARALSLAHARMVAAPSRCRLQHRAARGALAALVLWLGGCADDRRPTSPAPAVRAPRAAVVDVTGTPAPMAPPIPGEFTVTLPARGPYGDDSVMFVNDAARSFAESTLVRVVGRGQISRVWQATSEVRTFWHWLDAAGDWHSFSCPGSTGAYFFHPIAGWSGRELCIPNRPINAPRNLDPPPERIQTVWGWPMIRRSRAREPIPNSHACGPLFGPCFTYVGATTITVTPTSQTLTLTAAPAQVYEGDTVTFTAAPTTVTVRQWIWVPDRPPPMAVRMDSVEEHTRLASWETPIPACGTQRECRVALFESGTMYVRARVNAPGQRRVEQAFARVTVTRLELSVSCTPEPVLRGAQVDCSAEWNREAGQVTALVFVPDSGRQLPTVSRPINFPGRIEFWRGTAVWSGRLVARGRVGTREDSASTRISVSSRDWSAKQVPDSLKFIDTVYHDPPRDRSQLADIQPFLKARLDRVRRVDSGPNTGYWFAVDVPLQVDFLLHVNTQALRSGSLFWGMQSEQREPRTGPPPPLFCSRSDVVQALNLALAHEGRSRADINSHYSAALIYFDPRAGAATEAWVSSADFVVAAAFYQLLADAMAYSDTVAHDPLLDPYRPLRGCEFRY